MSANNCRKVVFIVKPVFSVVISLVEKKVYQNLIWSYGYKTRMFIGVCVPARLLDFMHMYNALCIFSGISRQAWFLGFLWLAEPVSYHRVCLPSFFKCLLPVYVICFYSPRSQWILCSFSSLSLLIYIYIG